MSNCACCLEKDETIKVLKNSLADRQEMCDYWWKTAEWWMGHRLGHPVKLKKPRPNHLKLVPSD